jgi:hypothetical protein
METEPLTSNDRCDSCGAQAYVQTFFSSGYLLFCAHHFRAHQEKLEAITTRVHDESHKLTPSNRLEAEEVE